MVYKIIFTHLFMFISFLSFSSVNEASRFSIITIGPYEDELYSAFGHSGIRYYNKSTGEDVFYNYGIFDFDQPNFYLNFLNGKLLYKVGKYSYPSAERFYRSQDRYIKEQILNLNPPDQILLYNYLEQNIKPENANYLYNYVYDNCATKIRDILEEVIGDKLSYAKYDEVISFRKLMDKYLDNNMWGDLGIDICLGPEIDSNIPYESKMFLPDYLFESLQSAKIGDTVDLVLETNEYIPSQNKLYKNIFSPNLIFFLLFIVVLFISFRQIKYDISFHKFDFLIFFLTGSVGLLLSYLWLFTDHLSTSNFNLFWAFPVNIIFCFLLITNFSRRLLNFYFILYSSILIALLILWNIIPQNLNESLVFLILAILVRTTTNIICLNRAKA